MIIIGAGIAGSMARGFFSSLQPEIYEAKGSERCSRLEARNVEKGDKHAKMSTGFKQSMKLKKRRREVL